MYSLPRSYLPPIHSASRRPYEQWKYLHVPPFHRWQAGPCGARIETSRYRSLYEVFNDRERPPPTKPNWNLDYATAFLVDFLAKSSESSVKKLQTAIQSLVRYEPGVESPDFLLYDAFNTLDEALFAGKLKNAVQLSRVSGHSFDLAGTTFVPERRGKRVAIELNSRVLFHATLKSLVGMGILIHQMIHAYLVTTCSEPAEGQPKDARLCHGRHFSALANAIDDIAISAFGHSLFIEGNPLGQGDFYHQLPFFPRGTFFRTQPDDQSGKLDEDSILGHTICIPYRKQDRESVNKWYKANCAPLLKAPSCTHGTKISTITGDGKIVEISRSKAGPSEKYVEFVVGEKSFQCLRQHLKNHPIFAKKAERIISIPKGVPEPIFKCLMSYLSTSSYGPDGSKNQIRGIMGPPLIREPFVNDPGYLITAIRVFKLAEILGFEELRLNSLQRLNGQHITQEDPLLVLAEIYDPSKSYQKDAEKRTSVSVDMLTWVKDFMARCEFVGYHPGRIPPNSNIRRVCRDAAAFFRLESLNPLLTEDLRLAYEQLVSFTGMSYSPSMYPPHFPSSIPNNIPRPASISPSFSFARPHELHHDPFHHRQELFNEDVLFRHRGGGSLATDPHFMREMYGYDSYYPAGRQSFY